MSVPLDRLYNYLQDIVKIDIIIYRWYPHGSKNLSDLQPLTNYGSIDLENLKPALIAYDQEPINFSQYVEEDIIKWKTQLSSVIPEIANVGNCEIVKMIQNTDLIFLNRILFKDRPIFCTHSELYSAEVEKIKNNNWIPIYFWSHALIARDWFRYAEFDISLDKKIIEKDFLIYNRAWSGTREYRLKFVEHLVDQNLSSYCKTSFNPVDNQVHYSNYKFENNDFQIAQYNFENCLPTNNHDSNSSADYTTQDYSSTAIEIVLETLFDDQRWHLTEKVLRPIACAQPFILAATAGSLEYLRRYGFETFDGLIDESYDKELDPKNRLAMIIDEIKRIATLPTNQKQKLYKDLTLIAKRNKQRFFSNNFHKLVINEFLENFDQAYRSITPSQS